MNDFVKNILAEWIVELEQEKGKKDARGENKKY
jgi:hypothetical protein